MEERKMCYVGRYSDRHVGTVLPSHDISDKWCSSGSGGRQENCQVRSTNTVVVYLFVPIAVKTMGTINRVGKEFLSDLGRRISQMTNEKREGAFLFQRLSMVIQRYNAVAIHGIQGTFALASPEDEF